MANVTWLLNPASLSEVNAELISNDEILESKFSEVLRELRDNEGNGMNWKTNHGSKKIISEIKDRMQFLIDAARLQISPAVANELTFAHWNKCAALNQISDQASKD